MHSDPTDEDHQGLQDKDEASCKRPVSRAHRLHQRGRPAHYPGHQRDPPKCHHSLVTTISINLTNANASQNSVNFIATCMSGMEFFRR